MICQKLQRREVSTKMSDLLMRRDTAEKAGKESNLNSFGKLKQVRQEETSHRKKYPRKIPGMKEPKKQRKR